MLTRAAVLWGDEKIYCRIRWYYSSMTWCCYGSGTFLAVLSIIHSVPMSPTALEFQSTSFTITVAWFKASLNQLASPKNSIIAYKIKWNSKLWHSNEAGLLESKPHYAVGSQAHVWLGCSIDRSHPVLQNDGWKCFPKWPCLFIYLYLYPAFLMGPKVAHIKHKKHKINLKEPYCYRKIWELKHIKQYIIDLTSLPHFSAPWLSFETRNILSNI